MAQAPNSAHPSLPEQLTTTRRGVKKLRNVIRDADRELARLEDILGADGELKRLQIGFQFDDTPRPETGEGNDNE